MENQLFDWKNWDVIDTMDFFFYDCELLVPVGKHPAGAKIKSIAMMYSSGVMEFYNDAQDTVIGTYNLFIRAEEDNG